MLPDFRLQSYSNQSSTVLTQKHQWNGLEIPKINPNASDGQSSTKGARIHNGIQSLQ